MAELYIQYVGFAVHINTRVAEIECLEKSASAELKKTKGRIENALRAGGSKVSEIKSELEVHPVYVDAVVEYNKLYFMRQLVRSYYEVYNKQASAISRVIELRKLEFEQLRREDNLAKPSPRPKGAARPLRHRRKS